MTRPIYLSLSHLLRQNGVCRSITSVWHVAPVPTPRTLHHPRASVVPQVPSRVLHHRRAANPANQGRLLRQRDLLLAMIVPEANFLRVLRQSPALDPAVMTAAHQGRMVVDLTVLVAGTAMRGRAESSTPTNFAPDQIQVANHTGTRPVRLQGFDEGQIGDRVMQMVAML